MAGASKGDSESPGDDKHMLANEDEALTKFDGDGSVRLIVRLPYFTINGKYFEEEGPAAKRPPRFSEDITLKRGLTEPERAVTQAIAEY